MTRTSQFFVSGLLCIVLVAGMAGCAAFRTKVSEVDVDKRQHLDATYDHTDLKDLTAGISEELIASAFLARHTEPPVMVIYGVQPRTRTFVDTKPLTDKIRNAVLASGKARFVNQARRDQLLEEQRHQSAHGAEASRVTVGQQLGAKYMLTGTLVEITKQTGRQVRVSRTELVYYSLTMEITDVQTGEIAWTTEREFARKERQPLIGW